MIKNQIGSISLTTEILRKNGFEERTDDGHYFTLCIEKLRTNDSGEYLKPDDLEKGECVVYLGVWQLGTSIFERKFVGQRPSSVSVPLRIQYVHQLQNLYFALTGKELKIEL